MLEIIALIALGRHIRSIAFEKDLKPWKYVLIMVMMWVGFEIIGAVVGAMIFGEGIGMYIIAILGAAMGAFLSYQIAKNATPAVIKSDQE